jgi:hypothetical protein
MSSNAPRHIVCRLLGGSGRPRFAVVSTRKLPALCAPIGRPAETLVPHSALPLAA